jgi:hypothetical protein
MRTHRDGYDKTADHPRSSAPTHRSDHTDDAASDVRDVDGRGTRGLLHLQRSAGNRAVTFVVDRAADRPDVAAALATIEALLDPAAIGEEPVGAAAPVQTSRTAVVQRDGPETPPEPKPGTPGDVVKALVATPAGKAATEALKEKAKQEVKSLAPGEKAAVVTASLVIGGGAVTAAMLRPDSRGFLLEQVSGKKVDIPGVSGLSAKIDFGKDGAPTGGMLYFNVGSVLPPSWGFK